MKKLTKEKKDFIRQFKDCIDFEIRVSKVSRVITMTPKEYIFSVFDKNDEFVKHIMKRIKNQKFNRYVCPINNYINLICIYDEIADILSKEYGIVDIKKDIKDLYKYVKDKNIEYLGVKNG